MERENLLSSPNIQDSPARKKGGCWAAVVTSFHHMFGITEDTPHMSPKDRLMMSPWEKWNKYSKFPWKSIIHTMIVMVVVVQVLLITIEYSDYARATNNTFDHMFRPEDQIFTIPEFIETVNTTLENYNAFILDSVDQYIHPRVPGNATLMPVTMTVTRYKKPFYNRTTDEYIYKNFRDLSTSTEEYFIWYGNLGPLNQTGDALHAFFYSLVEIQTEFQFQNLDIGIFGPVPFLWHLYVIYSFRNGGGQVDVQLWTAKEITGIGEFATLDMFTWLNGINLALNLASLILSCKAGYDHYKCYQKTKAKYNVRASIPAFTLNTKYATLKTVSLLDYYRTWDQVPVQVKMQFFNLWNLWITFGNMFAMVGCVLGILYDHGHGYELAYYFFLGTGAFFAICNMIRYLEYSSKFYTSIVTLRMAFLRVVFCIISVAPIYFGFAIFGVLMFSQFVELFEDLDQTSVTLFALLNGDTILDAFAELKDNFPYPFIGRIYMYLFNALFITAILNIFIFIIEDSYHNAKSWGKKAKKRRKGPPNFNIRKLFDVLEVKTRSTRRQELFGAQRRRRNDDSSRRDTPAYEAGEGNVDQQPTPSGWLSMRRPGARGEGDSSSQRRDAADDEGRISSSGSPLEQSGGSPRPDVKPQTELEMAMVPTETDDGGALQEDMEDISIRTADFHHVPSPTHLVAQPSHGSGIEVVPGTMSISTPMIRPPEMEGGGSPAAAVPAQATMPLTEYLEIKKQIDNMFQQQRQQTLKEMDQWMVRMRQIQEQLALRIERSVQLLEHLDRSLERKLESE